MVISVRQTKECGCHPKALLGETPFPATRHQEQLLRWSLSA